MTRREKMKMAEEFKTRYGKWMKRRTKENKVKKKRKIYNGMIYLKRKFKRQ